MTKRSRLAWVALVLLGACGGDDGAPADVTSDPIDGSVADAGAPDAGPRNDTDGDGLSDAQEDLDGDGVVDPGESDPTSADTDGDGTSDLVEWAAGTDRNDPASVPPADFLVLVLPPAASDVTTEVAFHASFTAVDIVFQLDTTSSMTGTLTNLSDSLDTTIIPGLAAAIPDVALGVTQFKDFPVLPFGTATDIPYGLVQRITTDAGAVQAALDSLIAAGGADGLESGIEALYQAVTGEGIMWDGPPAGEVAKFEAAEGYDPAAGHGLLGGVGFRDGAYPILVHVTDFVWHDGPDYWSYGIPDAHTRDEMIDAAYVSGFRVIGCTSSATARLELNEISAATRAVIPMPFAPPPACGFAFCPVTCNMDFSLGSTSFVDSVDLLLSQGPLDVYALAGGEDVDGVNPSVFIQSVLPSSPAPAGWIDGDTLREVPPGSFVPFTITAANSTVPAAAGARLWTITVDARAEGRIDLGQDQTVAIIVPAYP